MAAEVDAGHAVNLEAVEAFDAAVCEFLGRRWSRSAADAPSPEAGTGTRAGP